MPHVWHDLSLSVFMIAWGVWVGYRLGTLREQENAEKRKQMKDAAEQHATTWEHDVY